MLRITLKAAEDAEAETKDEVYVVDEDRLTLKESKLLFKFSGKNPLELFGSNDPEKVQALLWLAKYRAGEQPRYSALEDVDYADLAMLPVDADGEPLDETAREFESITDGLGNGEPAEEGS